MNIDRPDSKLQGYDILYQPSKNNNELNKTKSQKIRPTAINEESKKDGASAIETAPAKALSIPHHDEKGRDSVGESEIQNVDYWSNQDHAAMI